MESDIVTKVMDLAEVDTYHCRGSVCLDLMQGQAPSVVLCQNPVPVVGEDGTPLGFACLTREGSSPYEAEMWLTRATPERLELEGKTRDYYLRVSSLLANYCQDSLDSALTPRIICEIEIQELTLTTVPQNKDKPEDPVW